jgi:hypothetical protein
MRVISLSDPPHKKRHNDYYEAKKAEWVGRDSKAKQIVDGLEERVLKTPSAIGNVSVDPKDTRHVHVGAHGVLWWKIHKAAKEVEFIDIGHWDAFFG